jgi:AcrR family transcriptional regulator
MLFMHSTALLARTVCRNTAITLRYDSSHFTANFRQYSVCTNAAASQRPPPGASAASLYHYFADKEDLLQFTYTKTFEPLLTAAEEVYRTNLPAPERLEAILRLVFDNLAKHRELFSLLLKDDAALHLPGRDERLSRRIAIFAGIFRQGIEERAFRVLDTEQLAAVFVGAIAPLWQRLLLDRDGQHTGQAVTLLMDVFLHGITARLGHE